MATDSVLPSHLQLPDSEYVNQPDPVSIPINAAYICQDCDHVGNRAEKCTKCSSVSVMGLAKVINREVKPPSERVQKMCIELDSVLN